MRKVSIIVALGLLTILPATAMAAPATPHKNAKPVHARVVKQHAKLKTPAKQHTKRAVNDRALMTPKWS